MLDLELLLVDIFFPNLDWLCAPCGNDIPTFLYAYIVKPEQSNPLGDAPPYTYGTPKNFLAYETTSYPFAEDEVDVVAFASTLLSVFPEPLLVVTAVFLLDNKSFDTYASP